MKKIALIFTFAFLFSPIFAGTPPDEGMWLPMFIKDYNYEQMQKLGLQLTPEQLYDINHSSLKDAIVQLGGGFCTGEMISGEGLMLTNHHCGYQFIFKHSTEENDYLKEGFWAMSKEEELPNEGFNVSFLVRMEDVTHLVLDSIKEGVSDATRKKAIDIGCAFDGNWEALSSNIIYNPELQRCICVDIRYVMFVIDKVGGAGYLLEEMTFVE